MQTALKILSERPELAKQLNPARQASSGAAELAERTADEAPKHSAPQPERSRLSRQVSSGAADQAEHASSEAAQHAGQSHPGPVVSRGVAGSRLAKRLLQPESPILQMRALLEVGRRHVPSLPASPSLPVRTIQPYKKTTCASFQKLSAAGLPSRNHRACCREVSAAKT